SPPWTWSSAATIPRGAAAGQPQRRREEEWNHRGTEAQRHRENTEERERVGREIQPVRRPRPSHTLLLSPCFLCASVPLWFHLFSGEQAAAHLLLGDLLHAQAQRRGAHRQAALQGQLAHLAEGAHHQRLEALVDHLLAPPQLL